MKVSEYKALKNHIHNTLQVNRSVVDEVIHAYIEKRVKHLFYQYMNETDLEKLFADMVSEKLADPNSKWVVRRGWPARQASESTHAFIKGIIKDVIEKIIREKYDAKIIEKPIDRSEG